MAFVKDPLQDGIVKKINLYSEQLEDRIDDAFDDVYEQLEVEKEVLILQGNWTASTSFGVPSVRKYGKVVYLNGIVGSGSVGSVIATLPSWARPTEYVRVITGNNSIGENSVLQINPSNGQLTHVYGPVINLTLSVFTYIID